MNFTKKYRPKTIDKIIGQKHLFSPNSILYNLITKDKLTHCFFYGPPGTGKTTTAKIIATELNRDFYIFDGANFKINEIRKILDRNKNSFFKKPLVFIDEVHRLSKTQQEALLVPMENNELLIIGASTENPFYTLTNAIRSRSVLFEFKELLNNNLLQLLNHITENENLVIETNTKNLIIDLSNGDARTMLNLLEISSNISKEITSETIKNIKNIKTKDSSIDSKYNLISALIKSIRGSDVNASIYYLARLIDIQETPDYLARRLVILASEDIGNANPNALNIAVNTLTAVKEIGYPEARIILSQCTVYLASSPKSNSSYIAIDKALDYIENTSNIPKVPEHLKSGTKTYQNPHFQKTNQKYLSENLNFYNSNNIGYEKTLDEWIKN